MKYIIYIIEMLTDVYRGIYTQTIYYSDGTFETIKIPKGIIIIPSVINDDTL